MLRGPTRRGLPLARTAHDATAAADPIDGLPRAGTVHDATVAADPDHAAQSLQEMFESSSSVVKSQKSSMARIVLLAFAFAL